MKLTNQRIIISKTNQIGDVLFALPLATAIKQMAPNCTIIFLSRAYTGDLIKQYHDVDEFADWEEMIKQGEQHAITALKKLHADIIIHVHAQKNIAKLCYKAGIKTRIGTSHRIYNWLWCNKRVNISRSTSDLHETQLDMQFLRVFGAKKVFSLPEIIKLQNFNPFSSKAKWCDLLHPTKFNLILHPKTRGQHTEWPPEHFAELITLLPKSDYEIFVTGSEAEGNEVREYMISPFLHVHDLCGKLTLNELINFIAHADGMICASTGPVHLAAAFGINTLGLYAPIRPFHAGRWGPVGINAKSLCVNKSCDACRKKPKCHCITEISPQQVATEVKQWQKITHSSAAIHS